MDLGKKTWSIVVCVMSARNEKQCFWAVCVKKKGPIHLQGSSLRYLQVHTTFFTIDNLFPRLHLLLVEFLSKYRFLRKKSDAINSSGNWAHWNIMGECWVERVEGCFKFKIVILAKNIPSFFLNLRKELEFTSKH